MKPGQHQRWRAFLGTRGIASSCAMRGLTDRSAGASPVQGKPAASEAGPRRDAKTFAAPRTLRLPLPCI